MSVFTYYLAITWMLGNNLENYFYSPVSNFPVYGMSDLDKARVYKIMEQAALAKSFHDAKMELMAEK